MEKGSRVGMRAVNFGTVRENDDVIVCMVNHGATWKIFTCGCTL
jgi:hypothetical protein